MIVICENINICKQKCCNHSTPHEKIAFDPADINTVFDCCSDEIIIDFDIHCKCSQKHIRKSKLKKVNEDSNIL